MKQETITEKLSKQDYINRFRKAYGVYPAMRDMEINGQFKAALNSRHEDLFNYLDKIYEKTNGFLNLQLSSVWTNITKGFKGEWWAPYIIDFNDSYASFVLSPIMMGSKICQLNYKPVISGLIKSDRSLYLIGVACYNKNTNEIIDVNGYSWTAENLKKIWTGENLQKMNTDRGSTSSVDAIFKKDNPTTRDAKRISDVRQIQTALQMYYNDAGKYPVKELVVSGAKLVSEKDSKNVYLSQIPGAVLPVEGACAGKSNGSYNYAVSAKGDSYKMEYCLSNGIMGVSAGVHTATPSGINK